MVIVGGLLKVVDGWALTLIDKSVSLLTVNGPQYIEHLTVREDVSAQCIAE